MAEKVVINRRRAIPRRFFPLLLVFIIGLSASSSPSSNVRRVRKEIWRRCHLRRHLGQLECGSKEGANADDECCLILRLKRARPKEGDNASRNGRGRRRPRRGRLDNEVADHDQFFGKRLLKTASFKKSKKSAVLVKKKLTTKMTTTATTATTAKVSSIATTTKPARVWLPKQIPSLKKVRKSAFSGGHRRGIVRASRLSRKMDKDEFQTSGELILQEIEEKQRPELKALDRRLCAELKFPCRFISDHPCCKFEMPLGMVARARAMDGSADLR